MSSSGAASPNVPPSFEHSAQTEAEILKQQAAEAQAAISRVFSDLRKHVKEGVDPHQLTRDHPWIAISTAVAAGFAAAVTLIPSKEQQALRALAELERARHVPPPSPATASGVASDKSEATAGLLGFLAAEGVKMIRPLLTTLLTAGINRATSVAGNGASAERPDADASADGSAGNGRSPEESISSPS